MTHGKRAATYIVLVLLAAVVFSGCAQEPQVVVETREVPVTVEIPVTVMVQAPTLEPLPTYTAYPTYTAVPEPTATSTPVPTATAVPVPALTAKELDELLAAQPLSVVRTKYIVQDAKYKSLYPDMLSGVLLNNGTEDIRDATLAFAAWDANGLPILLAGSIDFSDATYVREAKATGINLVPGDEWGETSGFSLAENLEIDSFVAVAVSFTTFDNVVWENPYLDAWKALYEGKKRQAD